MTLSHTVPVLLVEDDIELRLAVAEYLEIHGYAVTQAGSGIEFYQIVAANKDFHVAIIDLGLPDQPGHVLAEYARRNTPMSVIIVTANDTLDKRIESFQTGADMFIGKPVDSRELLAAVRAMDTRYRERMQQAPVSAAPVQQANGWRLDRARRQLHAPGNGIIDISPKEAAILELFCVAGNANVERKTMLDTLYGREDSSAQRALDNLIRRLRQKISDTTGQPAPILTAYCIGHSFSEPLQRI